MKADDTTGINVISKTKNIFKGAMTGITQLSCVWPPRKGEHYVFSNICMANFNNVYAAKNGCYQHVKSKHHKELSKS